MLTSKSGTSGRLSGSGVPGFSDVGLVEYCFDLMTNLKRYPKKIPANKEFLNFLFKSVEKQSKKVDTAVSCEIKMKVSGKQVFLSFWAYYPLYGYKPKNQKVYFYK